MRWAFAAAAALALGGCALDFEGARCDAPGSTAECPSGQACGNDLRCSERALACASTRCNVGETRCTAPNSVQKCDAADPVCGTWVVQACGASKTCATKSATSAVCECNANAGPEFAADPSGSATTDPAKPTGLAADVQCRYKHLGDAVAAAAAASGPSTVKAYGSGAAGAAVVFSGEAFPLVVPPSVTVSGADAPAGETRIQGDAGTGAAMVSLQGALQGVHVANVSMTGNGVDMTCGATGAPSLRDVVVSSGATPLAKGVTVAGACGATLLRADVSGAAGLALDIAATSATAPLTVTGGAFHGNGSGIKIVGGTLLVQPDATAGGTQVTNNSGTGILLTGATPAVDATLTGVLVSSNGGTGLVVDGVSASSKLTLTSCNTYSNGAVSPTMYGPGTPQRVAGGILVRASLSSFVLQGNQIYANHGVTNATDEIAFDSTATWRLSSACTTANRIGCVASAGYAVSATGGSVDAASNYWYPYPPMVSVNVSNTSSYCGAWTVTCPP